MSEPYLALDRNSALQLSSKLGITDRRFWRWTSLPDHLVSEYRIITNSDGLWLGYIPVGHAEFVTLALVAPEDLRAALSIEHPPRTAEFLFYLFLDAKNCDALVGDLEERYKIIHQTFGARRANFSYWTQAIRSVGPIAWAWAKRMLLKPVIGVIGWALARGLVGHDSWLTAVVEILKRIRS